MKASLKVFLKILRIQKVFIRVPKVSLSVDIVSYLKVNRLSLDLLIFFPLIHSKQKQICVIQLAC